MVQNALKVTIAGTLGHMIIQKLKVNTLFDAMFQGQIKKKTFPMLHKMTNDVKSRELSNLKKVINIA